MTAAIAIRLAKIEDAALLPDIERSAGEAFRTVPGLEWIADDDVMSAEEHELYIDEGTVWVAEENDRLIGFLTAREEFDENCLHIFELAVEAGHQGKGIGRQLMTAIQEYAVRKNMSALTLTTFRDLAFNEAFYQKLGYRTLTANQISPRLQDILTAEAESSLPAERRCAMQLQL